MERFEEDVLIYVHSITKERRVTTGPRFLQHFPKVSAQRQLGLEFQKIKLAAERGRSHSTDQSSSDSVSKRICSKSSQSTTNDFFSGHLACISKQCNTAQHRNRTCTSVRCKRSRP